MMFDSREGEIAALMDRYEALWHGDPGAGDPDLDYARMANLALRVEAKARLKERGIEDPRTVVPAPEPQKEAVTMQWLELRIPRVLYDRFRLTYARSQGFDSMDALFDSDGNEDLGLEDWMDGVAARGIERELLVQEDLLFYRDVQQAAAIEEKIEFDTTHKH